jgi:hypothetical protein
MMEVAWQGSCGRRIELHQIGGIVELLGDILVKSELVGHGGPADLKSGSDGALTDVLMRTECSARDLT